MANKRDLAVGVNVIILDCPGDPQFVNCTGVIQKVEGYANRQHYVVKLTDNVRAMNTGSYWTRINGTVNLGAKQLRVDKDLKETNKELNKLSQPTVSSTEPKKFKLALF